MCIADTRARSLRLRPCALCEKEASFIFVRSARCTFRGMILDLLIPLGGVASLSVITPSPSLSLSLCHRHRQHLLGHVRASLWCFSAGASVKRRRPIFFFLVFVLMTGKPWGASGACVLDSYTYRLTCRGCGRGGNEGGITGCQPQGGGEGVGTARGMGEAMSS